jgi:hypothetical protein
MFADQGLSQRGELSIGSESRPSIARDLSMTCIVPGLGDMSCDLLLCICESVFE